MKLRDWRAEAAMVFLSVDDFNELTLLAYAELRAELQGRAS